MKVLEVNGHSGSRHGGAKKVKMSPFFMSVQELWKGSNIPLFHYHIMPSIKFMDLKPLSGPRLML